MAALSLLAKPWHIVNASAGYRKHVVLHDLNWTIERPATVALVGPNGAGKSTLLRLIAGLMVPAAGSVSVLAHTYGDRSTDAELRRAVGYLSQSPDVPQTFSVREYVAYAAWLKDVPAANQDSLVRDAILAVDLKARQDSKLKELSGGMRRRAQIAAAIVAKPQVLLLDEPTAGLDPAQRAHFHEVVDRLPAATTVLISTHLLEDVAEVCGQVVALAEGRIVYDGSVNDLQQRGNGSLMRGYTSVVRRAV